MNKQGVSWKNQNHSVLFVGWGVEPSTQIKYWILRNSYGSRFGMSGDFLLKRGENDFGIESDLISFYPDMCG